jgi:hypothetical protein
LLCRGIAIAHPENVDTIIARANIVSAKNKRKKNKRKKNVGQA